MEWIRDLHNRTSLFIKVLVANALIILAGSITAVVVVPRVWQGRTPTLVEEAMLMLVGLLLSLGVNYVILRLAFRPLFTLKATLERIRQGDFSARVPAVQGDPDMAGVTETANLMLDRLAEHRQAVAAQILSALEDERKRIARELHDETSQSLTSILVNLQGMETRLQPLPPELSDRLRLTREVAARTLDETRRLMFDLRPSVLDDLGLIPALRWFMSQRVQPTGMQVDFQASGVEGRLSEELETALFRILQEAITNVVKHAGARQLHVRLYQEADQIIGVVEDDGRGFSSAQAGLRKGEGMGLFGMRERATLVGGDVHIESAPGRGTTVRVITPARMGGGKSRGISS